MSYEPQLLFAAFGLLILLVLLMRCNAEWQEANE
jgi:hypothetical protein